MMLFKLTFLLALAVSHVRGHIAYWNHGNYLSPVQGLYVKPSADGTTGDLYVAATEDSAAKQWLTPATHHQAVPTAYATQLPREDIVVTTQKRAVMTSPTVKYSYAYPSPHEGTPTPTPYPYAIAVTSSAKPAEGATECSEAATPVQAYPQYAPFQYYYPQMLAAFAQAMNNMKEATAPASQEGESANKVPMWPSYYPAFQYVMVDPSAWAQSQGRGQAAPAASASSSSSESTTAAPPSPASSDESS